MIKSLRISLLSALIFPLLLSAQNSTIKVAVLGSSTAAGSGPSNTANAWVNQYRQYLKTLNASNDVINLAVGGYTTYQVMASDFTSPADRPSPDSEHNITKALTYNPDVIIVNLPTNDAASNYTVAEQLRNYRAIQAKASARNIPIYVATTQPRYGTADQRKNLMDVRDSINRVFGSKAIDFWTGIANEDGTIQTQYNSGDGVHLNDAAHTVLKDRVVAADILKYSRTESTHDTINIDFGTTLSSGTWNNLNTATQDTILNLTNTQNQSTGIAIWIHDAFTGVNINGTTTPNAALSIPSTASSDSFFGSVAPHNGVSEPTGGFTLSGLNKNNKYSFSFFASRTGITDNRETSYKVTGETEETVALDAANNTANMVTVKDMKPSANGTIIIAVGPGANNTNASKYYFIGFMRIVVEKQQAVYDANGTINIDFGSKPSSGTWNNFTSPTGGQIISDMVNTEGNSTGISLWVHDAFTGINEAGTTNPDSSLGIESNGSSDSFFGSVGPHSGVSEPTGGVTIGGLKQDSYYSLSFFASRDQATDNRETKYTVTGNKTESVSLDAANNTKNMVSILKMHPAADGTIKIDVAPGTNNTNSLKYYYLGVMRIVYGTDSPDGIHDNMVGETGASMYPNPVSDKATFIYTVNEPSKVEINIYDISGRLIHVIKNENALPGINEQTWNTASVSGGKLTQGMYFCKFIISNQKNTYSQTIKFQVK
jgi:lysophospholipase L1-like esterase